MVVLADAFLRERSRPSVRRARAASVVAIGFASEIRASCTDVSCARFTSAIERRTLFARQACEPHRRRIGRASPSTVVPEKEEHYAHFDLWLNILECDAREFNRHALAWTHAGMISNGLLD